LQAELVCRGSKEVQTRRMLTGGLALRSVQFIQIISVHKPLAYIALPLYAQCYTFYRQKTNSSRSWQNCHTS